MLQLTGGKWQSRPRCWTSNAVLYAWIPFPRAPALLGWRMALQPSHLGWVPGCGSGRQTGSHGCIWADPHPIAPLKQALGEDADKHIGRGSSLACLGWGRSRGEAGAGLGSMPTRTESASLSLCHRAVDEPPLCSGVERGCWATQKHLTTDLEEDGPVTAHLPKPQTSPTTPGRFSCYPATQRG